MALITQNEELWLSFYTRIQYFTVNSIKPSEDGWEKTYNVVLCVEFSVDKESDVDKRDYVSIDGLSEKELTLKNFYKKLKEIFPESVDA